MKNIRILISIFTSILFFACDDALDVKPENYLFEDQLVTDNKSAQSSLVGAYTQLNWIYAQYIELVPPLMDGTMTTTLTAGWFNQAFNNSYDSPTTTTNTMYEWPYYIVNSANTTITAVTDNDAVSEGEQERILGEAYFLRAFGHFVSLRLFGQFYDTSSSYGIVLRDVVSTFENGKQARATVQESYDLILSDLDESINRNVAFTNNYYASSTAAKAFKANVLLFMGGDENYFEAITLADEVINSGDVALEPNFQDIFINGEVNSEMIFARIAGEGQTNKSSYYYQTVMKASQFTIDYLVDDPRAEFTYDASNNRVKKIYTTEVTGGPTNFMRLAEVYLIKAECQARLNLLSEAETTLNIVRNRAFGGTAPDLVYSSQTELLDLIFDEYIKELCFETGSVWSAAIRYGKIEEINSNVTSTDQYILPIPSTELETNTLFGEQNPGYEGL